MNESGSFLEHIRQQQEAQAQAAAAQRQHEITTQQEQQRLHEIDPVLANLLDIAGILASELANRGVPQNCEVITSSGRKDYVIDRGWLLSYEISTSVGERGGRSHYRTALMESGRIVKDDKYGNENYQMPAQMQSHMESTVVLEPTLASERAFEPRDSVKRKLADLVVRHGVNPALFAGFSEV